MTVRAPRSRSPFLSAAPDRFALNPLLGGVLWADRENASNADQLSGAIDRLSAELRKRVGESLRTIGSEPPLDQVTTRSLEALKLYTQANRASNNADFTTAITLLDRAIALDSNFAMAYRSWVWCSATLGWIPRE